MITPKDKDKVLNAIIIRDEEAKKHEFEISYNDFFPDGDISCDDFRIILEQFNKIGLLSYMTGISGNSFYIHVTASLFDYYNHGGFVAQEEILLANLQKLGYELEILSKEANPNLLERIGNITEIAASVATALGLFRQ
jgi:hypothetical protein